MPFVAGKKAIGIAAIGQTSLALAQHSTLVLPTNYIDFKKKNICKRFRQQRIIY